MEPRDVTLFETLLPTARAREIRKIKLAGRDRIQAILRDARMV
jgi:hypothetical protein